MCRGFLTFFIFFSLTIGICAQDNAISIQAEDADSLGSDFNIVTDGDITYITPSTDFANANYPGTSEKVATYQITFPDTGFYSLFVRLRVGPMTYNDDSFFYGKGFGVKNDTVSADWVLINGLASAGFTGANQVVDSAGIVGSEVWKWVNVTKNSYQGTTGDSFYVSTDSLTKTFQIGSRENGLDIDKIAFGKSNLYYTVYDLDNDTSGSSEYPKPNLILSVNLSDSLRAVTHCAIGALYGVTETIPGDIANLVAPLKPNVYVQPALDGSGHQAPFGAAIPVSDRLSNTTAKVMIRLADICPNFPYVWPGWSSWSSQVTGVINNKLASGRNNFYGYEIWNEHQGTWNTTNGDFYTTLWKPTYDLIRSLDPDAKIIGPSDSYYSSTRIQEFLTFCQNNNCLPDIICWHELQGSANISIHINSYRLLEKNLRISPIPISINEYCDIDKAKEGCPGTSAPFIAKFERNLVNSASISWWFTNLPGRLGSLLTGNNEKGGGWWFYKWYGDMTGYMANVTPPNENSDGIDGFACLDTVRQYASICLGGNDSGMVDVDVNGIPSSFGDSVDVKVEYVSWSGKDLPVSGPVTLSFATNNVSNGAITVPVNVTSPLYGYRVFITPVGKIVGVEPVQRIVPYDFSLSQNYPNPFNPETIIEYSIPTTQFVSIKVFDILGREVSELVNERKSAGKYSVKFDGTDLSSGIYIYTINAGSYHQVKKMVLAK